MSCLLSNPPDYDEVDHRPVIVTRLPSSDFVLIDKDGPRRYTDFSVVAWDGDERQSLRYRWLLDRDQVRFPCSVVSPDGSVARLNGDGTQTAEFRIDHNSLNAGKCHRLSVVLTDGDWDESTEENCIDVVEGANRLIDSWWLVAYDSAIELDDVPWTDCLPLATVDL